MYDAAQYLFVFAVTGQRNCTRLVIEEPPYLGFIPVIIEPVGLDELELNCPVL